MSKETPQEQKPEKEPRAEQVEQPVKQDAKQEPPSAPAELNPDKEHHEHIHDILMNQDEITWRSIILELIKTDQMDPWNIDLSKLSKKFISTLKKMKEMNLNVSGKVILCAALLLRVKSSRLIGDDLMEFDKLLATNDQEDIYSDEDFVNEQLGGIGVKVGKEHLMLIPKTPQPRKRKVSVYDLIDALAIALNTRRRRVLNNITTKTMEIPDKPIDISQLMNDLHGEVIGYLTKEENERMAFSQLVPGDSKLDKIHTFIPLLHLTNARKVNLDQNGHFKEIWVTLSKDKQTKEEPEKQESVKAPVPEAKPAA